MAKIALVVLLVAALAVAGFAREPVSMRALQQANNKPSFTCAQAKGLQGRGCSDMLNCLKARPEFKTLGTPENLNLFKKSCERCAAATKSCPANNALPSECRAGLAFAPVLACAQKLAPKGPATKPAGL